VTRAPVHEALRRSSFASVPMGRSTWRVLDESELVGAAVANGLGSSVSFGSTRSPSRSRVPRRRLISAAISATTLLIRPRFRAGASGSSKRFS